MNLKQKIILLLLLIPSLTFSAEVEDAEARIIKIAINASVYDQIPELIEHIKAVLISTGLELTFTILPAKRALLATVKGDYAMALYRTPVAVDNLPSLIKITPYINERNIWLLTGDEALCNVPLEELRQYSSVGIQGIKLFNNHVAKLFKSIDYVNDIDTLIRMLSKKRVDFSAWSKKETNKIIKKTGYKIYICNRPPLVKFQFFSYIHKNYAWAIPQIEKAYQKAYSTGRQ